LLFEMLAEAAGWWARVIRIWDCKLCSQIHSQVCWDKRTLLDSHIHVLDRFLLSKSVLKKGKASEDCIKGCGGTERW